MEYSNVLYLTSSNATSKDLTTGRAQWVLDPVISFPQGSKISTTLHSFSFTNFFVNITTGVNDKFYYSNDLLNLTKYSITIAQGSYSVTELSDAINIGVINNGHADGLIVLTPDFATNKVLFSLSVAGWILNFPAGTPYVLLGTNLNQTIPNGALTVGAYSELAPNVATFNSILSLYVHSNITNNSVFNGRQSNVIGTVIPTASIGSVQDNKEMNLIWIDASNLAGQSLNDVSVYITDQTDKSVNLSDDFSLVLIFSQK